MSPLPLRTRPAALALAVALVAGAAAPAQAACYAEYRAQRTNPVQLAFGVAQIPGTDCSVQAADRHLRAALGRAGWTLSNIVSTVDRTSAPANSGYTNGHYLRF